ncbi:MAG: SGNH/GDSL hydrolase family protein [Kiritimatiellae bacterium]|nr:SGNH/GDSL hydrolase family protein [Kiritimatiellia bacterium]
MKKGIVLGSVVAAAACAAAAADMQKKLADELSASADRHPVSENVRGHENTEWSTAYAYHLIDSRKSLPRVLLVGDSICGEYKDDVRRQLEGKVNVSYWMSSYCVTSPHYLTLLGVQLDEAKYDVVHFNNGLHSLGTPDARWAEGLERALRLVRERQPQAKIVWATSTPLKDPLRTDKVKALNAAGEEVVKRLGGIGRDDLFAVLDPLDREKNWRDIFHHRSEAARLLRRKVAEAVLEALRRDGGGVAGRQADVL